MVTQQPQSDADGQRAATLDMDSAEGTPSAMGEVVNDLQQTAGQAIDQAKQTGSQVIEGARQQTTSQLTSMKEQTADTLGEVAEAVRHTGQRLQRQHAGIARTTTMAADRIEQISGYLHARDVNALVDDVEGFARRQPALFLGGAFTLGLVAARFMKSSRHEAEAAQAHGTAQQAEQQAATTPLLPPPSSASTTGTGLPDDMLTPDLGMETTDTLAQAMVGSTTTPDSIIEDESGLVLGAATTGSAASTQAEEGMIEGQTIRYQARL